MKEHNFVVDYLKDEISKFSYNEDYQKSPHLIHQGEMTHLKTEITSTLKKEIDPFWLVWVYIEKREHNDVPFLKDVYL